jgi:dTDP-4-dehydrorhamnose 3,5-epimerase
MEGVLFTPLRRIPTPGGDVRHGLKASDASFAGFGEAYFSSVEGGAVKGWKRHTRMTLNLVVPVGEVRFLVCSDSGERRAYQLSPDRAEGYGRLTVPPGLWMAFGGVGGGLNLLLNVASIEHDPAEAESRPLDAMPWSWTGDEA